MRGKKTGGRNFKPGDRANPEGRPKMPEHLRNAKLLNQVECQEILNRLIRMQASEVRALAETEDSTSFEVMLSRVVVEAMDKGDQMRVDFLLNRLIGKVTNNINLSAPKILEILKPDGTGERIMIEGDE